jgi:hypothetical protein
VPDLDARFQKYADDHQMTKDEAIKHLAAYGLANKETSLAAMCAVGGALAANLMRKEAARLEDWFSATEETARRETTVEAQPALAQVVQIKSARRVG